MRFIRTLSNYITQYFPLWVVLFAAAAFFQPAPFKPLGTYIPYLLGLIMLGMGLTMSLNDFKLVLTRPKDVLFGIVLRYIIMPVVAFLVAKLLGLPPALAAGLILVGACPSGTASNVMTFIAKGDTALSVTVSSFNTILAPILTPFIFLYFAGTMIPIQAGALLVDILKIVLLPVFIGITLRMIASSLVDKVNNLIPAFSVIAIIMIITAVVALNATKLVTIAGMAFLAVILHNSIGLFLGYASSRVTGMSESKARAISFEIGMENSGLAVALAMAHLDPIAAIPGAIFSVWHNFSGSLLAGFWSTRKINNQKTL
ncbi:bile acid:sodium symporter family protein [Pelosinus sp. UFO1]|uniref:bile acid:sodium symporter family protein n=1 Tax=Pelosinus sp. UFO1 TaxID=484770 RepID=UPI0004D1ECDD|nr:bile acid:sodium symporter family protein [Pelosinus sp. UFO1]AIF53962.1 Bile acid:sodium symporter [Pelosinus sp. UFO1]